MKTILARSLLGAVVLSAPLVVLLLELPANVLAGCGLYGYGCQEPVCFGVEVTTDSGSTWRDGQVYVYGAPGSQISITVRTVLSISSGAIQGWSFGVSPEASALVGVNGGDFVQTAAANGALSSVRCGSPPDFYATRRWTCGYTQGLVLDMNGSGCELSAPAEVVTSYACFTVTFPTTQGVYPVTLEFVDDVGQTPVQSMVTSDGATSIPCKLGLELKVYSSTSYYPTASYCPLSSSSALECDEDGDGGGAGAGIGETLPIARDFRRGDSNNDGAVNVSDPVHLLGHMFLGDAEPGCRDAADADDNEVLNITDAIFVLLRRRWRRRRLGRLRLHHHRRRRGRNPRNRL